MVSLLTDGVLMMGKFAISIPNLGCLPKPIKKVIIPIIDILFPINLDNNTATVSFPPYLHLQEGLQI